MPDRSSLSASTYAKASPLPTAASEGPIQVDTAAAAFTETDPIKLQRQLCFELAKLTSALNAKSPLAQTYSPFIHRRGGLLTQESGVPLTPLDAEEYDALGQQFNTLVIISTFTANLIIAFLTVCNNIVSRMDTQPQITFEVGMFFSLLGMAVHAGVIIIAARCAALALKHSKWLTAEAQRKQDEGARPSGDYTGTAGYEDDGVHLLDATCFPGPLIGKESEQLQGPSQPTTATDADRRRENDASEGKDEYPLKDFRRFLKVCESLQLLGTATFFFSVAIFIFLIFPHIYFPIVLLAGCAPSACLLAWRIGFWRISATHQLIALVQKALCQGNSGGSKDKNLERESGAGSTDHPREKAQSRLSLRNPFKGSAEDNLDLEKGRGREVQ